MLFTLFGKIKIDGAKESVSALASVKSGVDSAAGSFGGMATAVAAQGKSTVSALGGIRAAVAAVRAAMVVSAARMGLEAAASYDSLVRGLATVSSSTEDLQSQLSRLQEIAKLPGIGFEEAVKGSLQLQAVGLQAKSAEAALAGFANAAARAGGSKEDFAEAVKQMTQIASAGKLTQENLGVIAERIPGFTNVVKDAFGSMDYEKINKQGLTGVQIVEKISASLAKLPKASGGIRTALDNMGDLLNQKLLVPIGRIAAGFLGAIGPSLERLLNTAAPGFERMAAAAEKLSKSSLATFFNNTIGNLQGLIRVATVATGVFVAMAGPSVVGRVVGGISAIIKALQALRSAIQTTGLITVVMEAIATKGRSLATVAASLAAGLAAAGAVNLALNKLFEGGGGKSGPFVPGDIQTAGKGPMSGLLDQIKSGNDQLIKAAMDAQADKRDRQDKYLLAIERNTAKSADALTLRRQSLGGRELGQLGVTAAEMGGSRAGAMYAPPETFSRPTGSELQRVIDKMVDQRMAQKGMSGRLRNG